MPQHRSRPAPVRIGRRALALLAIFHLCALLVPWEPAPPAAELDSSWALVLSEAFARRWQWGTELVFTYGPFGFLLTRLAHPGVYGTSLLLWAAIAAAEAAALLRLVRERRLAPAGAVYALAALLLATSNEVLFFSAPLLAALLWVRSRGPADAASALALVVLLALGALMKTSFAPAALVACLVLDGHEIARRRPPPFSALLVLSCLALYAAAGQGLGQLPGFLASAFEISAGYSAAMGRGERAWELPLFLGTAAWLFCFLCGRLRRHPELPRSSRAALAAIWAASAFLAMKAGFTREAPENADVAWGSLVLLSLFPLVAFAPGPRLTRGALAASLAIPLAGSFALRPVLEDPAQVLGSFALRSLARQAAALRALATAPQAFWEAQERRWEAGLAWIREVHPLPPIRGTLDVIPSVQGALLAHRLDFRPRPVFQEYCAYTERLLERNREFLAGPGGAASVLFRPGSIDARYPSLAESTSWPVLLGSFLPVGFVGFHSGLLLLKRAEPPLPVPLQELDPIDARLKEWTRLPPEESLFVRIDLEPTLLGRLATLLVRAPATTLQVEVESGARSRHRFVPAIGRAGFLLSPRIRNNTTFAALAFGRPDLFRGERVTRLKFRADLATRLAWRREFRIRVFRLDLSALRRREMPADFAAALEAGGGP